MKSLPRGVARVIAVTVPVVLSVALADAASASTPTTWAPGEGYSTMQVLLIYIGIPLGLFVVIALLASINPGKYADSYPIRPQEQPEEQWFGGPEELGAAGGGAVSRGEAARDGEDHAELGEGTEPSDTRAASEPGGGASASW